MAIAIRLKFTAASLVLEKSIASVITMNDFPAQPQQRDRSINSVEFLKLPPARQQVLGAVLPQSREVSQELTHSQSLEIKSDRLEGLQGVARNCRVCLEFLLLAGWVCLLDRYGELSSMAIHGGDLGSGSYLQLPSPLAGERSFEELLQEDFGLARVAFGEGETARFGFQWGRERVALKNVSHLLLSLQAKRENYLELVAQLHYNPTQFERAEVESLLGHFPQLLEAIAADSKQPIARLSLLTEAERQQLFSWGRPRRDYPRQATIHELFARQAGRTPEAVAIAFEDRRITYGELERRSNQLAHLLLEQGLEPEARIGLWAKRSPTVIVALLAILKAGGAYLPLDLKSPPERLAAILAEANCSLLLSCGGIEAPAIAGDRCCKILDLETMSELIATRPVGIPQVSVAAENLAYVMYTSGSTGKPKGVSVLHRGVVRLVKNNNYARFDRDRVFLQLAPLAFDASTFEIWGALLNGGQLAIAPPEMPSLAGLARLIRYHRVTTLWLTAGLFHLAVDEGLEGFEGLQELLAGGDALSVSHVEKALTQLPNCQLINGYGPTENTTFSCCYRIERDRPLGNSVPIGRPIANSEVYLLDRYLQPVPVGIAGEIYLGGDGLARGYLQREELTAERFIPHPFTTEIGAKLYRSGDRGRWRDDGTIEFLGRLDFQVKLRGYRIELSEVERCLLAHPEVRSAVAMVREKAGTRPRLVAYVVRQTPGLDSLQLQRFVATQLPEYMVPSAIAFLSELPLNRNGKVDRRALSEIDPRRTILAPQTRVEKQLVTIWETVLGIEVGIGDRLGDLGGDSLHATQIASRIGDSWGVSLPIRAVLEADTLAELARQIEVGREKNDEISMSLTKSDRSSQDLPLSLYQERIWLILQKAGSQPIHNLPMAFRLRGQLDVAKLEQAVNRIVARHEALRTLFPRRDGVPRQRILSDLRLRIESDRGSLDSETIQAWIEAQARQPFNLEQEPPLRVRLLQLAPQDWILSIVVHHIAADGWSLGILKRELSHFYRQTSEPLPLPARQYSDFSIAHRCWLEKSQTYEPLVKYWNSQLADAPPLLELRERRPRPSCQTFVGCILGFAVDRSLTEQLKQVARLEKATLFMTLLAAFKILLWRYSKSGDIVVGSPIANRNHTELEATVGCFANLVPLRSHLSDDLTFLELLAHLRETALEAYTYQDFPVEQLLPALKSARNPSYAPWFQVVFILLNVPMEALNFPGIEVSSLPLEKGTSLFDLTLLMQETPQGLAGTFEFNTELFNSQRIQQAIAHFQGLLAAIAAHPQQKLSSLVSEISLEGKPHFISEILETARTASASTTPKDELEVYLVRLWQEVIGSEPTSTTDNFFALGGDSLAAMRLLARLEKDRGQSYPLNTLFQAPTIQQLAQVIRRSPTPQSALIPLRSTGSKLPYFFVAPAGASALSLQEFVSHLDRERPIYILQDPALEAAATPYHSVEELAAFYLQAIRQYQRSGTYLIGGACFGGIVAYEMACQLAREKQAVSLVLVEAFWPEDVRERPNSVFYLLQYITYHLNVLSMLEGTQKLKHILKKFRWNLNRIYDRLAKQKTKNLSLTGRIFYAIDRSRQLRLKYRTPIFPGRIHFIVPDKKTHWFTSDSDREELMAAWSEFARGGVEIRSFWGHHELMFQDPFVRDLAEKLQDTLDQLESSELEVR